MFNTSYYNAGSHTNNFKINAVTGAILKNHPKSWFEKFHLDSARAKHLLLDGGHKATKEVWHDTPNSYYSGGYYVEERNEDKDITVLQMVVCGDMEVIAELVYTKDYETNTEDNHIEKEHWLNCLDCPKIDSRKAVDYAHLHNWFIDSVGTEEPVWTRAHIDELLDGFIVIPKEDTEEYIK